MEVIVFGSAEKEHVGFLSISFLNTVYFANHGPFLALQSAPGIVYH